VSEVPQLLLAHHLKALKLPTFLREHDKLARRCAAEGVDHTAYLLRLAELEPLERERRLVERRIRAARFPAVKSLGSFDFAAIPALNKLLVLELTRCAYLEQRENVIALGPSGTGKTHVALGLGLAACQRGLAVGCTTAAALVHELLEARDERRLLRLQKQLAAYKAKAVRAWIAAVGATTAYIEPGSPWENGYLESFDARLRDELLDGEVFYSLAEAKVVIESWRRHYNSDRPRSALGYRPPAPEVALDPMSLTVDGVARL
jgi:transposase InsO family protein